MHSLTDFLTRILTSTGEGPNLWQGLSAVFIAYFGGVISSLTPCVYPMIPITVSVVGGMNSTGTSKRSWHEVSIRSLVYVSGMSVTYSFLGVLAGLTGKVFGSFTNSAGWYFGLGLVMTATALIMLDVIPFDPISWWNSIKHKFQTLKKHLRHRHGHHNKGSHSTAHTAGGAASSDPFVRKEMTLFGAFMLGASSGFIAAPCTTPVLTSILAYIAKTQSIGLGLLLMFAFSAGLGTLLLIIAAFTGALRIMPRSGNWMKLVKVASGVLLLVFAEYLIYRSGTLGGI